MDTNLPSAQVRTVAACVKANVPVLAMGDPGIGKTSVLEHLGRAWGRHVETISSGSREAVDFMGLPMEADGQVVYSPLSWAKRLAAADKAILVVDEITTARSTFKAFLRVLQERVVGEFELPDTVSIVALANPPEIAVDGVDLPSPVANRFIHVDWKVDVGDWLDNVATGWAHAPVPDPETYLAPGGPDDRARVAGQVVGFIRANPQHLQDHPEQIDDQGGAWPSARSWDNVMKVLACVRPDDTDVIDRVVTGGVGKRVARDYLTWTLQMDLPDPRSVLADPASVNWMDRRVDRTFAILSAVAALVRLDGERKTWLAGLEVTRACARAGRPDVALAAAQQLANSAHAATGLPTGSRSDFADLFDGGRVRKAAS